MDPYSHPRQATANLDNCSLPLFRCGFACHHSEVISAERHAFSVQRAAVAAGFFGQGLVFIALTTKLPMMQKKFGLDPGMFSLLLLGLVIAAGVGSFIGEWLAPRRGSAMALRVGYGTMVAALPLLALAPSVFALAAAQVLYGLALGLVDAGTNMQGVAIEHEYRRPIMPTFHGAWTLGGIVGTLGSLATHRVSFETSAIGLAVIPLVLACGPYLKVGGPIVPIGDDGGPVPWRRILLVGAAMVLFYMADTAVTTWGPTYLDKQFTASAALVSIATLPYLAASLVGRGAGDGLARRFGAPRLIVAAAIIGALGMSGVVFAPNAAFAMGSFLVLGLGLSVIAPLSYSAAASIARESVHHDDPIAVRAKVDAIVARFNQFNYAGGLLGAVMTGAVGNNTLRFGFAVPMVLILGIIPLARAFRS